MVPNYRRLIQAPSLESVLFILRNAVDERLLWIFSLHLLQAFARKLMDETSGSSHSHNMPF